LKESSHGQLIDSADRRKKDGKSREFREQQRGGDEPGKVGTRKAKSRLALTGSLEEN